jgi:hypothetical protein
MVGTSKSSEQGCFASLSPLGLALYDKWALPILDWHRRKKDLGYLKNLICMNWYLIWPAAVFGLHLLAGQE